MDGVLEAYTDGACIPNPRRGGVGIRFVYADETGKERTEDISPPGFRRATNNEMELPACIIALEEARKLTVPFRVSKIVIYTDSLYLVDNLPSARGTWPRNGWFRRDGSPVLNVELWKKLTKRIRGAGVRVELKWVKGHFKNQHNRTADRLARESARNAINPPLLIVSVGRKLSQGPEKRGSVAVRGQRVTIRVITCQWLREQKLWKLKYEVISRASPDRGRVDTVFTRELLKDRHCHHVRLAKEKGYPEVVKVYREVECPKKSKAK